MMRESVVGRARMVFFLCVEGEVQNWRRVFFGGEEGAASKQVGSEPHNYLHTLLWVLAGSEIRLAG